MKAHEMMMEQQESNMFIGTVMSMSHILDEGVIETIHHLTSGLLYSSHTMHNAHY